MPHLPADVRAQVDALHDSVAARNDESTPMDINAAWEAKRPALRLIFEAGRNNKRELEFEHFKTTAGPDLDSFATWCPCFEVWGAPWGENRWFFEKTIDDRPCASSSRSTTTCSSSTAGCSGSLPSR